MKTKKNRIISTTFIRDDGNGHSIVLGLEGKIPNLGYGAKEIIKMLKKNIIKP
jgi:hypothetical protein